MLEVFEGERRGGYHGDDEDFGGDFVVAGQDWGAQCCFDFPVSLSSMGA